MNFFFYLIFLCVNVSELIINASNIFQEQYISEGGVLGTWDNSMKSVLCFGEDYSNYIRRKSELPSLDLISSDIGDLQVAKIVL